MTKRQFLLLLQEQLAGLPRDEADERLSFYSEIIDDRVEDGLSEEEAVATIGLVDEVVQQILADIPLAKIMKSTVKRRRTVTEVVLLVLSSPVWVVLLIAVLAVAFSLYVSLWAVVVSLWACFAALLSCAIGGLVGGIVLAVHGHLPSGLATLAAGLVCAGLSVFWFFGCRVATKGVIWLGKKSLLLVKRGFIRKGEA